MAKDYENLTHHESLRYDYLQKNIHFLSDRDRAELHYLEAKMAGKISPKPNSKETNRLVKNELPSFRSAPKTVAVTPGQTPEGLPAFNPQPTRTRRSPNQEPVVSKPFQKFQENRMTKQDPITPLTTTSKPTDALPEGDSKPLVEESLPRLASRSERRKAQIESRKFNPKQIVKDVQADKHQRNKAQNANRKTSSSWGKKVLTGLGVTVLITLLTMFLLFLKGYHDVQQDTKTAEAAEVEYFDGQETRDGINILVLGTDSRIGQSSAEARTDSIMVVNIGNSDGKIKMVSFMRDTLINIPEVSYDDGMNTYYDQKLNTAFSIGEQDNSKGAEAIRVALKDHFDLDIKYYAMVDFQTFATAIDTIFPNGVQMTAKFGTVDGEAVDSVQVPDDLNAANGIVPEQTIKVGKQSMDGRTLLNYARFRKDDAGDFGRTERQQQVLAAILQQVKDPTKLFTGSAALGKIMGMTSTNVPYSFILGNGISVLSDASNGIERTTVPEIGDWVDEYDMYGGLGLAIDFEAYKERLAELGFR